MVGALIAAEFSIVSLTRARRLVALMGLERERGGGGRNYERDPITPVINKAGAPSSISPRLRNPRARCVSAGTTCLTYHPAILPIAQPHLEKVSPDYTFASYLRRAFVAHLREVK